MKVRILSGNQTGAVVEMSKTEAEANISTGYAEAVAEEVAPVKAPESDPEPEEEKKFKYHRREN